MISKFKYTILFIFITIAVIFGAIKAGQSIEPESNPNNALSVDDFLLLTHTCKDEKESCRSLMSYGVDPEMFISKLEYRTSLQRLASHEHSPNKPDYFQNIGQLRTHNIEETYKFAEQNGISLSDSYTSHWPKP